MNPGSHGRRQPSGLVVYPVYSVNFVFLPPLQYAQQYVPQQYQQQFPQYDQAHEEFDQGQFDQSQQAGQFDQFAEGSQFHLFDHNAKFDEAGSFEHFAQFGQHNPPSDFKLFVHPIQNEDSRRHSDFGIKRHRTKTYYRSGSLEGEQSASGKQVHAHTQDVQHANGAGNARRKQHKQQQQQQMRNTGGASKQPTNFSHPLLMTQLKGHGGAVLDMDFSPNGRFLATCADDGASSGTSSGSEGNKENTPSKTVGLSRRQKKNYRGRREDSSSPGTTVKKKSVTSGRLTKSLLNHDINKQYAKLCWKGVSGGDMSIIHHLKKHVLNPDDLLWMGYPVESSTYPGHAIVYKPSLDYSKTIHNTHHYNKSKSPMKTAASEQSDQPIMGFDVNAREFAPKVVNYGTTLIKRNSDPDFKAQIPAATSPKKMCANECQAARKCVRCGKEYFVSQDGSYLTTEQCVYHWGKLRTQFDRNSLYECCKGEQNTKGCTTGKLHVWNGLHENCFNPLPGFVKTRPRKTPLPESLGLSVYAIDCEMCYTTQGFELARITVVSSDGRLVYDTYVRPENEVVDYNTRFSGITANEINKQGASKVLREVQNDLMGFIYADTILIGHGVENDLIALKMIHTTIIDTAYVFPHFFGLPYKRSLKSLVKFCLKREIQMEATGHDSFEDARSCLELMLWKLQEDHAQSSVLSANRL